MPDPTRFHAYLARIKDQEKDVIAVPDGAGRALCISSDKHWTLTREWDELHIIAPLVEDEGLKRTRADDDAARWRRAHSIVEQERDTARRERDGWEEKYLDTDEALHRTRQERDEAWRVAGEQTRLERDRAEAAERERDEWQARAEAAEARTAVTRDEVEQAIRGKVWAANREPNKAGFHRVHVDWATDAIHALVSGDDPAVFVIRESDLPTVRQDDDGEWYPEGRWDLADDRFIDVEGALEKMHRYAAIARAIEAKEDSIMVRARELLDLAHPGEYAWTGAFETCRRIAEGEARQAALRKKIAE